MWSVESSTSEASTLPLPVCAERKRLTSARAGTIRKTQEAAIAYDRDLILRGRLLFGTCLLCLHINIEKHPLTLRSLSTSEVEERNELATRQKALMALEP